ncbi:type III secretion protein [Escherichia coli]|nr:type III secretion protein [Escherichia coli]
MINSFEDLPVKIEFVLGKKIMNLYEIDELCAKRIISLLPESEKKNTCKWRANWLWRTC